MCLLIYPHLTHAHAHALMSTNIIEDSAASAPQSLEELRNLMNPEYLAKLIAREITERSCAVGYLEEFEFKGRKYVNIFTSMVLTQNPRARKLIYTLNLRTNKPTAKSRSQQILTPITLAHIHNYYDKCKAAEALHNQPVGFSDE